MSGDKITSEMLINYGMSVIVLVFGVCAILLGYGKARDKWLKRKGK